ncbi:unnamed protein product [Ceutorhynchus assimilis]|uniref:DnaJ homolog subfamily C member 22 n=1 Tax=Ceutorhynchus assimilis TaxID=467358 RepID=A0A9N9MII7_9CUCU|nr:unnamed protein product [Ceutorhynchus assimilis]
MESGNRKKATRNEADTGLGRKSKLSGTFCALGNLFGMSKDSQSADVGGVFGAYNRHDRKLNKSNAQQQEKTQNTSPTNNTNQETTRNSRQKPTEPEWVQPLRNSANSTKKKSIFWAYFFWLFGGIFGIHLFYLERDTQAFLTWSTFGGYVMGWLSDIFKIPAYVRDCNQDPQFIEDLIEKMRRNKKPPFSTSRFISALMVSYLWGQMVLLAIPEEEIYGINWNSYLHWFIPFGVALGVWVVGNIGREQGKLWLTLVVSYLCYATRWYYYDENIWLTVMMFGTAFTFDTYSKEWRKTPKKKKPFYRRLAVLIFCAVLYIGIWSSYLYFNGKVTNSEGDEIPIHEALHHFFSSSMWTDFKQSLNDLYQYAQHHGWYEIWKQLIDLSDPQGEQNAYKILGVGPTSSQQEITARWRKLSRENHPDKCKDANRLREAQERFMEIQQAYEILSNIKHKRNRKNKKSVRDDTEL